MSNNTNPLNPLSPVNPSQQISEGNKTSTVEKKPYRENQEGVFLPSRGLFYSGEFNGMEYLKVRPFDYTDEDILTTESYYTNNTIFDEILNNTILNEKFKAKHLVAIDRDTILIWLRATAFGPEFEINFTCPNCEHGNGTESGPGTLKWNLTDIEFPQYPDDIYDQLKNEKGVLIRTPLTNTGVRITVPSLGRQKAIENRYKEKKIKEKLSKDFFATTTLLSVVSGVEVEEGRFVYDTMDIDAYFKKINLPLSDSRYILKKSKELNLKYETKKTFECKDCKHIEEGVELPMLHRNFFWPDFE